MSNLRIWWKKVDKRALAIDAAIVCIVVMGTLVITVICVNELREKEEALEDVRFKASAIREKLEETTRKVEELRPLYKEALRKLPGYEESIYDEP